MPYADKNKTKKVLAKWRAENRDYARNYYRANKEYFRQYRKRNQSRYRQKFKEWYWKNKEYVDLIRKAHKAVYNALHSGKLIKQPCIFPDCGLLKTEAHHNDYNKLLDVRWFCRPHHRQQHWK
jgi:hypothetical protein